ncbi:MAG TPA: STAS domain-containing protein [Tepidisphaeraceae bacterium]|jgi:stage II sporulation protein AA (anti-sigma F factor antagonist)|nr:STAS domain-containing protein [Tepidisphaeraceae bacterium]
MTNRNDAPRDLFLVHPTDSATVIELLLPDALDPIEFDRLNDSLLTAIAVNPAGVWVLDLAGTSYMGSAVLGLLVNLRQRIKTSSGQLALCSLSPALLGIFHACSLQRLFLIAKSRDEALNNLRRN